MKRAILTANLCTKIVSFFKIYKHNACYSKTSSCPMWYKLKRNSYHLHLGSSVQKEQKYILELSHKTLSRRPC